MNRIDFTLPSIGILELREVEGLVWIEDGYLVLEVKNKLLGLVDEDLQVIKIEPTALREVYLHQRPFKDRLVLVPKKRELLDAIPGKHVNDVRLRIWKTKRRQIQKLISEFDTLKGRLAERAAERAAESVQQD